jgi:TonB family protein
MRALAVGTLLLVIESAATLAQVPPASPILNQPAPAYAAAGRLIKKVDPIYPATAANAHLQGDVIVELTIGKDGVPKDVKVACGPDVFGIYAIDAVSQWRWEPYRIDGVAVDMESRVGVHFQLPGQSNLAPTNCPLSGVATPTPSIAAAGPPRLPPPPEGVLRVSAKVMSANLVSRVEPGYPSDSVALDARGAVLLLATITRTGDVTDAQFVSGPLRFRDSAIAAVKQWKYKPYLVDDQPVEAQTAITLNFAPPPGGVAEGAPQPVVSTDGETHTVRNPNGGKISPPVLIYSVEPMFSAAARKAHVAGNVLVNIWIDEKGNPTHVHVRRGFGVAQGSTSLDPSVPQAVAEELNKAAADAASQYRFKPAMQDGKPILVELNIEVNFSLH